MIFDAFLTPLLTLATIFLGIFLPGAILLLPLHKKFSLSILEFFLVAFGLGITFINTSLLILGNLGFTLNLMTLCIWYGLFFFVSILFLFFTHNLSFPKLHPFLLTKKSWQIAAIILLTSFFIKGFYLSQSILPTTTDLGHHLYWAKVTSDTGLLPTYEKQEIVVSEEGTYSVSDPTPIADFIIGEHLSIALIAIFTGASYFGIFPFIFLFLLNILALLSLAALVTYLGEKIITTLKWRHITKEHFFLSALFLFGILFSVASPEMKFVSGGVIGNLFGNLFIPLILLFFLRALTEKSPWLIVLTLLLITNLAYTHHLSTFILLYIFIAFGIITLIFFGRAAIPEILSWLKLIPTRPVLIFLATLFLFASFIAIPTYLETNAVSTAVGTPTKDTRTGLSLFQLSASNSAFKVGAAFFALVIIVSLRAFRKSIIGVFLFAWGTVLLVMTLAPQLLLVNIPSNRIANYTSFPISILTLITFFVILEHLLKKSSLTKEGPQYSHSYPFVFISFFLLLTLFTPGLEDNGSTLPGKNNGAFVKQTFDAARYLEKNTTSDTRILKDHNFIEAGDTWMKLFFNRGYNYPFSRSFFKRYEDNPKREQCTLAMISTPNTPFGKKCYEEIQVEFVVVNPKYDKAQFQKSSAFSLVYFSPEIAIFKHTKQ